MNLGKLLGAGKSFVSGSKLSPYRADKRIYLPQFVSPKNPFANPGADAGARHAELPEAVADNSAVQALTSRPAWVKTQKMPVAAPSGVRSRATAWMGRLNPVSRFNAAPAASKLATPVQVELSLEKVKVVHNDLTDADVEFVPMKSRPAREPAAAEPAKKSWTNLGERIMKATAL